MLTFLNLYAKTDSRHSNGDDPMKKEKSGLHIKFTFQEKKSWLKIKIGKKFCYKKIFFFLFWILLNVFVSSEKRMNNNKKFPENICIMDFWTKSKNEK